MIPSIKIFHSLSPLQNIKNASVVPKGILMRLNFEHKTPYVTQKRTQESYVSRNIANTRGLYIHYFCLSGILHDFFDLGNKKVDFEGKTDIITLHRMRYNVI